MAPSLSFLRAVLVVLPLSLALLTGCDDDDPTPGQTAGSAGQAAAGAGGAGDSGAGGSGAGGAAGNQPCQQPHFLCLASCDATTATAPSTDYCHTTPCPAGMKSTDECGFCQGTVDCGVPPTSVGVCTYAGGTWKFCCPGDPGC